MNLAAELQALRPQVQRSPLPGYEHVQGYGIFAFPLDSGHALALRVFPQNDFAPYVTVWHCDPQGAWSIFVDAPRVEIACPRYYGAAARHVQRASIRLHWLAPARLRIEMDSPQLLWEVQMRASPLVRTMNAISLYLPEPLWRSAAVLRTLERVAGRLFDLGDITLSGTAPNGHFTILMPRRMFPIASATVTLEGRDLGQPTRSPVNAQLGGLRLPARPVFAIGGAYFRIQDPVEHERTCNAMQAANGHSHR